MWGGCLIAFAVLRSDPYQVSSIYFLFGIVQLFLAVSMIVLVLEESRDARDELRKVVEGKESEALELTSALRVKSTALSASEARFRALAKAAPVAIMETDADGRPMFVNDRWREYVGRELDKEPGGWLGRVIPEDSEKVRTAWARCLGDERGYSIEFRLRRGDGVRWVLGQAVTLRDRRQRVTGCLVTLADIDELKAEQERRLALESQLRQSQKMETLGTLAGGVAHGFNNLLQPIMGFTHLALDSLEERHEAREDLEYVARAAGRATELVKQMLTFSRQAEHERMPLSMDALVGEALKLLRASLPSNISLEASISRNCPPVMADATQIHQVVMNLGANAYHAVRDNRGKIRVELEAEKVDEAEAAAVPGLRPGTYARLTVSDTGAGMDAATRERVFEPFFTTKRGGQGTGLGLSVVHGIVMSHDGVVTLESEPGRGTVFRIWFPATMELPAESPDAERSAPRGSEHILLVDDDEDVAQFGKITLERLGYRITMTTDSLEARRVFSEQPEDFDLVITDQMMPNLTGDKLAEQMLHARRDIPIIMITGFGDRISPEESRRIGIREFILKPVGTDSLGRAVRNVLDAGPGGN